VSDKDDLARLRQEVRKRRSAVTGKERRILNNTGIDIRNTTEDPRRPPSVVNKYNRAQLNNYLGKLNAFMSRGNGYIPDASGGFIRKSEWLAYKRIEKVYNEKAAGHFNKIKDIVDPYRNKTIAEADRLYRPDSAMAQGDVSHRPLSPVNGRKAQNIKNAAALEKLKRQLEGKLDQKYLPAQITKGRQQAESMLDNAGLSDLKKAMGKLNTDQFNVLWNYWGFGTRLGQLGSSGSHRSKNVREMEGQDRLSSQDKDNIRQDVLDMITEAGKLDLSKTVEGFVNTDKAESRRLVTAMRKNARAGDPDAQAWMKVNNRKY